MVSHDTVAVYSFRQLAWGVESAPFSSCKATREAIEQRGLGEVLEGTEEWVMRDELDTDGTWRRRPTGWGDLS